MSSCNFEAKSLYQNNKADWFTYTYTFKLLVRLSQEKEHELEDNIKNVLSVNIDFYACFVFVVFTLC